VLVGRTWPPTANYGGNYGIKKTGCGTDCAAVHRMQAPKLHYHKESQEHSGKAGVQKVLSL
jgi:hypothetical protein